MIKLWFLNSFFWKVKVPSEVQVFISVVVLDSIRTNNLSQTWRPDCTLILDICVMCFWSLKVNNHLFLRGWEVIAWSFAVFWICEVFTLTWKLSFPSTRQVELKERSKELKALRCRVLFAECLVYSWSGLPQFLMTKPLTPLLLEVWQCFQLLLG